MQLQQLRYFIAAAEEGSISAAAKKLFLAQPTLSQQILNLEKELGIALFVRHSKSIRLTEAGEQFLLHAKRIIGETEQLQNLMQKHSLLQEGTLRIGMLWVAGYLDLFQLLETYHKRYPALLYQLKIDGSNTLLKLLQERKLHAVFMIGDEAELSEDKSLSFQKIMDDSYTLMVPASHPLAEKKSICAADLRGIPLVMPSPASAFRKRVDRLFEACHFQPEILCESSQPDIVAKLTESGLGLAFSSLSIAKRIKTASQVLVPFEPAMYRTIYYVTLKELLNYPSIRSFTRFVSAYCFEPKSPGSI